MSPHFGSDFNAEAKRLFSDYSNRPEASRLGEESMRTGKDF
jgi:hypothetical protein